ncbi:DUF222 domain-containing protein [Amycolatopsis halotolerans]|uniref:DUF222 domain-containing protein n=1 Tax=Amycolatopsis halotolerans TaxID=330083 RepID=A0ABV7QMC1_9PSEU
MPRPIESPAALKLAELLRDTQRQLNTVYARQLAGIREFEATGEIIEGYSSTAAFLCAVLHLTRRDARTRVAQATAALPLTGKALAVGEITAQHVAVIAECLADAPDWLTSEDCAVAEETLVTLAVQADPAVVRRAAARLRGYWDSDGTAPSGDDTGSGSGQRSGEAARPWREFRCHWTHTGRFRFTGEVDGETGALVEQLLVPLAAPDPADATGVPDPRTPAERDGDAFAAIADLAASAPDLPTKAGERAVATVTVSLEQLQGAARAAFLEDGTVLPVSRLRRMLCDAKVYPAVLGGEGQILDLGRSARTATAAQRRALAVRDLGCTFPGCDRGPKWTNPHHVVHWADGGSTDLENQALCCERHHRLLHHSGWRIAIRDSVVWWIPPALLDPDQKPLRNTAHYRPPATGSVPVAASPPAPPEVAQAPGSTAESGMTGAALR